MRFGPLDFARGHPSGCVSAVWCWRQPHEFFFATVQLEHGLLPLDVLEPLQNIIS